MSGTCAVRSTWVPPHSSMEAPGTSTTLTDASLYFSPNIATAPAGTAGHDEHHMAGKISSGMQQSVQVLFDIHSLSTALLLRSGHVISVSWYQK